MRAIRTDGEQMKGERAVYGYFRCKDCDNHWRAKTAKVCRRSKNIEEQ